MVFEKMVVFVGGVTVVGKQKRRGVRMSGRS